MFVFISNKENNFWDKSQTDEARIVFGLLGYGDLATGPVGPLRLLRAGRVCLLLKRSESALPPVRTAGACV